MKFYLKYFFSIMVCIIICGGVGVIGSAQQTEKSKSDFLAYNTHQQLAILRYAGHCKFNNDLVEIEDMVGTAGFAREFSANVPITIIDKSITDIPSCENALNIKKQVESMIDKESEDSILSNSYDIAVGTGICQAMYLAIRYQDQIYKNSDGFALLTKWADLFVPDAGVYNLKCVKYQEDFDKLFTHYGGAIF